MRPAVHVVLRPSNRVGSRGEVGERVLLLVHGTVDIHGSAVPQKAPEDGKDAKAKEEEQGPLEDPKTGEQLELEKLGGKITTAGPDPATGQEVRTFISGRRILSTEYARVRRHDDFEQ